MMMTDTNGENGYTTDEMMQGLVNQISAYIEQYHGGSVELISFDGEKLKVRLGGACVGCPLSAQTLHGWVKGTVQQFFPDVEVIGVE
jgi:Fe-S cluster biogenesis protein NfuA